MWTFSTDFKVYWGSSCPQGLNCKMQLLNSVTTPTAFSFMRVTGQATMYTQHCKYFLGRFPSGFLNFWPLLLSVNSFCTWLGQPHELCETSSSQLKSQEEQSRDCLLRSVSWHWELCTSYEQSWRFCVRTKKKLPVSLQHIPPAHLFPFLFVCSLQGAGRSVPCALRGTS